MARPQDRAAAFSKVDRPCQTKGGSGGSRAAFLLASGPQRNREAGAAARRLVGPYAAAMRFGNRPRDGQADTHSIIFGGDERVEQPLANLRRDPGAAVRH